MAIHGKIPLRPDILEDWDITDTANMKEGYEIHENKESYFLIFDSYDVSRTEVSIDEQELMED